MARDGQIKQPTGTADYSYLLVHCSWWRSHTFFTRLVGRLEGLSGRRFHPLNTRVLYIYDTLAQAHT